MRGRSTRGFIQIPLLLFTLAITSGALGTWGLLRRWRHLAETQLRLDQCTARTALDFKEAMEKISGDNLRIRALRAEIVAASLAPEALPALHTLLNAQVAVQEARLARWKIKSALWLSRRSCGDSGDHPLPLPSMEWIRNPPDGIGPQELHWAGILPAEFRIEIGHPPRRAAARVFQGTGTKGGLLVQSSHWQAEWTAPKGFFGTGLY